jgi:predicted pyridoxine 5'-phosphate oxidase superfamily flavin-nucleotide-binding protein
VPINPVVAVIPVPQAAAQADLPSGGGSMASALAQAVQQAETASTLASSAASLSGLDAISQIAANAGAKPRPRTQRREDGGEREPIDERRASLQERARRHPLLNLF